jgi:uncharacterized protein (DUF2141 family)
VIQRSVQVRRFPGLVTVSIGLFLSMAPRFSAPLAAQAVGTATLTVRVTGARNAKGKIRAALFQDAKAFPNDASKAVHTQAADIDPQTSSPQIVFGDLPGGVYAVSVFHGEI